MSGSQTSATPSFEQQLNKLQNETESMSTTISELKEQVASLKEANLSLQQSNKAMAEQIARLEGNVGAAAKDIEALNRVACCVAGFPLDYYNYIEQRFGPFYPPGLKILVEFGDGKQIMVNPPSTK
jgi:DNA repair exonuclease SbcCD ATPase subunit